MTEMLQSPATPEMTALLTRLSSIEETGANRFSPPRYRFITSLARRATFHRETVAAILRQKALLALQAYEEDLSAEKCKASLIVERISTQFPSSREKMQALFEGYEFKNMLRLEQRLLRSESDTPATELHLRIGQFNASKKENLADTSLSNRLRQQEHSLLQSLDQPVRTDPKSSQIEGSSPSLPSELSSLQHFRESWARMSADALVTKAMEECPADAGPLNPQKLVIHSLSAMRDLSPHYLNRFVGQFETLLWLEQLAEKVDKSPGS